MRTLLLSTLLGTYLALLGIFVAPARAQNPAGANAGRYQIAVVDVSYIFKEHQGFKQKMEGMKQQMQSIDSQMKGKRDEIAQLEQRKASYTPGSQEFRNLDETIARAKADFSLETTKLRKDFLEREAKIYYETYLEVDRAVQSYAQRNNLGLVLRFDGERVDPNIREDVLRGINKAVVFQNSIDITPDVLGLLNREGVPPADSSSEARGQQDRQVR